MNEPQGTRVRPMTIHTEIVDPERDPRWDQFVEKHPHGWICHLSGWKKVLEQAFKHMKGYYFVAVDDNGEIKGGLPAFHVQSWLPGDRIVSVPFATLCDPLVDTPETLAILLSSLEELQANLKARYIEIRTLHTPHLFEEHHFAAVRYYKHHFLKLDKAPDELKRKFHRSCVRQRISRAIKSNFQLKIGETESDLAEFYRLQLMTRRRHNLPPQPYRFFRCLWDIFGPTGGVSVLLAKKDGYSAAAMILLKFGDRLSVEYSASDDSFTRMSPNHFLFWEAIRLAYEEGYKIFDFGRTAPDNKNLMDFKRRWGTQVVDLPQFLYPKDAKPVFVDGNDSWKQRMVMRLCKYAPDSFQKVIGNFCYRHLG